MPLNNPAPLFALLTAYDMRSHSGQEVFTRSGGSAVSLASFSAGEGVYEDGLFFLNGRSSATNITATGQMNVNTFGSSWAITLSSEDRVTITADVDFEVTHTGTVDAFGLGSATINATQVGSDYVVTAPNDWARGAINLGSVSYRFDEVGGSSTFSAPAINVHVQDLTVFLRDQATVNDVDVSALSSLEKLDQTAQSVDAISWFITDDGHAACSYLTTAGDISWTNTTIRDLLGFTGTETAVVYSTSYSLLTSTHKMSGVLTPTRPYQRHHLKVDTLSQARRLIGGGYVSNHIGSYTTSALSFALDALLDVTDDYKHFINRWLPYASSGERVNFYQCWGDSRRALNTASITGTQAAYDTLYTSEDNGEYGRIRGSLITSTFDLSYPNRMKRRVPVNMDIEHL